MGAYDWQSAMEYAKFEFKDVAEVLHAEEGEHEGRDWQLIVRLKDGRFGWLSAGCDYSGWDCQSSGQSGIHKTVKAAVAAMRKVEDNGEIKL